MSFLLMVIQRNPLSCPCPCALFASQRARVCAFGRFKCSTAIFNAHILVYYLLLKTEMSTGVAPW